MVRTHLTDDQVAQTGQERYEREIRARVEPSHNGQFLALDVESGDYEIDPIDIRATQRLHQRRPAAVTFLLRIGHPTAYRLGCSRSVRQ